MNMSLENQIVRKLAVFVLAAAVAAPLMVFASDKYGGGSNAGRSDGRYSSSGGYSSASAARSAARAGCTSSCGYSVSRSPSGDYSYSRRDSGGSSSGSSIYRPPSSSSPTPSPSTPVVDLYPNRFSAISGCTDATMFDASGNCPATALRLVIGNLGSTVGAGARIPYQFAYQLDGQSTWTDLSMQTYTGGVPTGGTSGTLNDSIANLPIGRHQARITINNPQSVDFPEAATANNVLTTPLVVTPPPAVIALTVDKDIVRPTDTVRLTWDIIAPYTMQCELQNSDSSVYSFTHATGTTNNASSPFVSAPIQSTHQFAIRCLPNPVPGFTIGIATASTTVEAVPMAQEI